MKKILLWLLLVGLLVFFVLSFIFKYCYTDGCGSPFIVEIVKSRKKLELQLFPPETINFANYKDRSIATYIDENGRNVSVFGGYFDKVDIENMIMWVIGDNNKEYGFMFDSEKDFRFVDLKTETPEELYLKISDLRGLILKGEYVHVYWSGLESESVDGTVNSVGSPIYQIDRYRTNNSKLIR